MLRYIAVIARPKYFTGTFYLTSRWPPPGLVRARRFFEKGALRFVVLDLLTVKPAHGYEIIRSLEERSQGFYTPSPGSIYPTLQLLQDQGYVTSAESEGKKTYTITDKGRKYLVTHSDIVDGLREVAKSRRSHTWLREEFQEITAELRRLGQLFIQRAPQLTQKQIGRIRDVVKKASREIEDIIEP
jgi:DNA-binding PadR family transcriptional regulator